MSAKCTPGCSVKMSPHDIKKISWYDWELLSNGTVINTFTIILYINSIIVVLFSKCPHDTPHDVPPWHNTFTSRDNWKLFLIDTAINTFTNIST